mmetsp:Transcript_22162/g.21383  ORF Transcript_22162/g.21383 Transcript_22162/m.21383 type:complete len:240 (+) Transcript_22162:33-752(+)
MLGDLKFPALDQEDAAGEVALGEHHLAPSELPFLHIAEDLVQGDPAQIRKDVELLDEFDFFGDFLLFMVLDDSLVGFLLQGDQDHVRGHLDGGRPWPRIDQRQLPESVSSLQSGYDLEVGEGVGFLLIELVLQLLIGKQLLIPWFADETTDPCQVVVVDDVLVALVHDVLAVFLQKVRVLYKVQVDCDLHWYPHVDGPMQHHVESSPYVPIVEDGLALTVELHRHVLAHGEEELLGELL